jgi:hypothetical protein
MLLLHTIMQQLQLCSIRSSLSTLKHCLSEQLSYSSFTVAHVTIQGCTALASAFNWLRPRFLTRDCYETRTVQFALFRNTRTYVRYYANNTPFIYIVERTCSSATLRLVPRRRKILM